MSFSLDEWQGHEARYAAQARLAARRTLMVNSISREPVSHGGAFCFVDGAVEQKLPYDREGILSVQV